jgi:hypothetical protein
MTKKENEIDEMKKIEKEQTVLTNLRSANT